VPCRHTLATNSLMLRSDFGRSEKGRAYIWIDPPWRMTLAGPVGGYTQPLEHRPDRFVRRRFARHDGFLPARGL